MTVVQLYKSISRFLSLSPPLSLSLPPCCLSLSHTRSSSCKILSHILTESASVPVNAGLANKSRTVLSFSILCDCLSLSNSLCTVSLCSLCFLSPSHTRSSSISLFLFFSLSFFSLLHTHNVSDTHFPYKEPLAHTLSKCLVLCDCMYRPHKVALSKRFC